MFLKLVLNAMTMNIKIHNMLLKFQNLWNLINVLIDFNFFFDNLLTILIVTWLVSM